MSVSKEVFDKAINFIKQNPNCSTSIVVKHLQGTNAWNIWQFKDLENALHSHANRGEILDFEGESNRNKPNKILRCWRVFGSYVWQVENS